MHKKIFWLEDHPDIGAINLIEDLSQGRLSAKKLLENTFFAYDFNSAKEILISKENRFDLYITDGDFPLAMEDSQRRRVDNFLREVYENGKKINILEGGFKDQHYNAFVEFALEYLLDKPFVVHSMSEDAKRLSFLLGWQFYEKGYLEKGSEKPYFLNEKIFYHSDITSSLPGEVFDKAYTFIKNSSRWESCEGMPNFFKLKKISELPDIWVWGNSRSLIQDRIVPLFE